MYKRLLTVLAIILVTISATPAAAQSGEGPRYLVQPGDTLSSIAAQFNVTIEDLMDANDISDPNLLSAGQELVIPGLEGVSGLLLTEVVQFGDSFRSLSRRSQVPEPMLCKLNRLVSPSQLYVGVSLIVPQEQNETRYTSRVTPGVGESLLELAAKQNSDPWTLVRINSLQGTWSALPGDVLYSPGEASDPTATGLPAVFSEASVRELPLVQGETAVIRVKVPEGVTASGQFTDHTLRFFPDADGSLVALQGIHALLEPGPYPLRLEATLPDGSVQSFEQMVLIASGNYQREDLYVESNTIDPLVTEPENERIVSVTEAANPARYWTGAFSSPAVYPDCFTSRYGTRRTYYGLNTDTEIQGFHTGLDFCGGEGLQITAPASGMVVFAEPVTVRGNATIIDHGWGVYSGFWHQSAILVQKGDMVEQGQGIGLVGGTGRVTGAHLHWEVWVNGVQVNPMDWLTQTFP
jgi:murein DD-endopeptidase MepM/ murein hydrolase activator NlpD